MGENGSSRIDGPDSGLHHAPSFVTATHTMLILFDAGTVAITAMERG